MLRLQAAPIPCPTLHARPPRHKERTNIQPTHLDKLRQAQAMQPCHASVMRVHSSSAEGTHTVRSAHHHQGAVPPGYPPAPPPKPQHGAHVQRHTLPPPKNTHVRAHICTIAQAVKPPNTHTYLSSCQTASWPPCPAGTAGCRCPQGWARGPAPTQAAASACRRACAPQAPGGWGSRAAPPPAAPPAARPTCRRSASTRPGPPHGTAPPVGWGPHGGWVEQPCRTVPHGVQQEGAGVQAGGRSQREEDGW